LLPLLFSIFFSSAGLPNMYKGNQLPVKEIILEGKQGGKRFNKR
jgi:hypothetical protein